MSTTPMKHVLRVLAVLILAFTGLFPAASTMAASPAAVSMAGIYDNLVMYDNFDNTANDGSYDPGLWAWGQSDTANFVVQQSNGVILFKTTTASGDGDGVLELTRPGARTPAEMHQFQADLKLSSVSGNYTIVKIQIHSNNINGHSWWTQCFLGADGQSTPTFGCDMKSNGVSEYSTPQQSVSFDTWVTARIEIDPATGQLDFYMNDQKIGSHLPAEAEALKISASLQPRIGMWTSTGGSSAVRAVDNVLISGGTAAAEDLNALHIALADPYNYDPGLAGTIDGMHLAGALFRGLVKLDSQTGALVPDLASGWAWNTNKDEVTFTLRPGLKWSDGVALTASDFRFGMLRALKNQGEYALYLDAIVNATGYRTGAITDPNQVGIYVDSPTQLRIKLAQTDLMLIYRMTFPVSFAVPEHLVTVRPDSWLWSGVVVSSGPYLMRGWTNDGIRLSANPFYYGAAPKIDKIIIRFTQDAGWNWNQFLQGNLDTVEMTGAQMRVANQDAILKKDVLTAYNDCTYGLYFNLTRQPFDNVNVRKAFMAAINRNQFITNAAGGGGTAIQTFTPPSIYGAVDGVAKGIGIPSNDTQAKQYLSDAGYPNGTGFPAVTIDSIDTPYNHLRWSELVSRWKGVLGVTVNVNYKASDVWDGTIQPLRFSGWCADYGDAYNFVKDGVDYSRNMGYLGTWNNPTYNSLTTQMSQTEDPAARLPLYEQAETIITETDLVIGPIYASLTATLSRPYLHRLYTNLMVQPWEEWFIQRNDSTTYTPGETTTFTPDVDNTTYTFPSDFTGQQVTLTHTVLPPEEITPAPAGLNDIGRAFRLDLVTPQFVVVNAGTLQLNAQSPSFTITIPYSLEEVQAGEIFNESMLALYANVNGQWVKQNSVVDPATHTLTGTTQAVNTEFIILGTETIRTFIPVIMRFH